MDLIGYLRRIQNAGAAETFDQATDSLEAIRDFLVAGGAGSPGLYYYGVVSAIPGANQFTVPELAGLGAGKFIGAYTYQVFVLWDDGGAGAAPQGEMQPVTAYANDGTFTHNAFTVALAAGDEVLVIHPRLAEIFGISDKLAGAEADTQIAARNLFAGVATSGATGADILTITTTTRTKVHMLMVSMVNCAALATVTVRIYTEVNGVEVEFYNQDFIEGTDPDGIMAIDGTLAILADLRVEMQSSAAADVAVTVPYSYITEDME